MASFTDRVMSALKGNDSKKNSRSPIDDPFFAESLIIQSKSIVGRMYSANEYARHKYECELNQLVKQYRVWRAEIKREEREVVGKLDTMRQEQRETKRDLKTIQLVAKTNREFINHYKKRRNKALDGANKRGPLLDYPPKLHGGNFKARGDAKREKTRLPEIVKIKKAEVVTKEVPRVVSLPFIVTRKNENQGIAATKSAGNSEISTVDTKISKRVDLIKDAELCNTEANVLPLPRVLSAPKSKSETGELEVFTTRPSSACETGFQQ